MKLHELSVKRPVAVTMAALIFVVIGLYSMTMLDTELMPDMDMSMAIVYTSYPNVGSEEVENLVTKNIESAISSVSGVDTIKSQSSEGTSLVMVQFATGTDMDEATADMEDRIDMIADFLPEDAEDPTVMKMDTSAMPVAMMSVSVEGYDMVQTKKYIEDNIENKLEAVDGVGSVTVTGATDRIIEITVDPEKMFGYNMSMSDVIGAVAAQNKNLPAGSTEGMNKNLSIRTIGKFEDIYDIDFVPLTTSSGQVIYLRDIASVKDTYEEDSTYARLNGEAAISVMVSAESDANTVDVVNGVISALDAAKAQNPKFTYNITMEQASYIESSINSVTNNAVTGALLAILILLLFLGSIKTALVIGVSMPISVVTTFIGMYFSGMTLNTVSLGGLALGIGMLVDNSVVVLENIFRRRNELGEDSKVASIKGSGEVIGAVVASVLTTCIVYVPILFIDNMMAVMFKQLAFAIIFSQCASLVTTFLLIPMLSSKIKDTGETNRKLGFILKPFNKLLGWFYRIYEKALRAVLKHRKKFVAGVLALFALSLFALTQIGMTLMSSTDEGSLSIDVTLPAGSRLEETDKLTRQIEEIVSANESVETVFANVGSGSMAMLGSSAEDSSSLTVTLKDSRTKATTDVVQELRDQLADISGAEIEIQASNSTMSMSADEIQFNFMGADDDVLTEYVLKAEEVLAGIDGVKETSTSISETQPEVRVKLDSAKAARYGLNTSTAATLVKYALDSTTASRYTEGGSEYDIVVKYPDDYVENYRDLQNLQIKTASGQWITLGDITNITVEQGQTTLQRIDQKRVISLTAQLYGTDMQTANRQFEEAIKTIEIPDGVTREAGGTFEIMIEAMQSLVLAILLGILLMYLVMAAQFESMSQPLIILASLPLSIIGVVLSLIIAGDPLSVVSCIGILMLVGIVVNNAIVLIDFINTAHKEQPDMTRTELLVYAGKTRMRPVLMTSLTSILGFLPMAVSNAEGSETMAPLAVVLLGGLAVGTFLTLLVIPVVYTIFDDKHNKRMAKKERKALRRAEKKQAAAKV